MTFLTNEQVMMFEREIKNHNINIQEWCKIIEEKIKEGMLEVIKEEMRSWTCENTSK